MQRIGFIGLGLMGEGMARNIHRVGFPLIVYNRTRAKAEAFADDTGCTVADAPRQVAEASDIVITMVSDVPDVEQVYLGDRGIIEAAHRDLLCIDMSTVGPDCVRRIHAALAEREVDFIDAPVSGGIWGAQQGTLSIMAGGSKQAFDRAMPVFEAMGKKMVYCGEIGMGQTTKLVNQIVGAVNLEAVCEGLIFAEKAGGNVQAILEAVGAGAAGSWAWSNLGPRIAGRDFAPGFKIAHMIKDLRLSLDEAERLGLALPGVRLVLEKMQAVQAAHENGSELGTQAMITTWEERYGTETAT